MKNKELTKKELRKKRAQTSIETTIMLTISLLILTLFLALSWDQISGNYVLNQQRIGSEALKTLKNEIDDTYFLGVGTTKQVMIYMPDLIDLNKSFIQDNYLVLNVGNTDFVEQSEIEVRGLWPNESGSNLFTINSYEDYVTIYVSLLSFSPTAINITQNQGFEIDFNLNVANFDSISKNYLMEIDFESDDVNISSPLNNQVINFGVSEIKTIEFDIRCDTNSSGNYTGELLFSSDINSSIPINITCVASQSKLTIFPKDKIINTEGQEGIENLLVCNNSITDYEIISTSLNGSIREYIIYSFNGDINAGQCRDLTLNILTHDGGSYSGELSIIANGLKAKSNITIEN